MSLEQTLRQIVRLVKGIEIQRVNNSRVSLLVRSFSDDESLLCFEVDFLQSNPSKEAIVRILEALSVATDEHTRSATFHTVASIQIHLNVTFKDSAQIRIVN